jgi:hypothetical protein
MSTWPEEGGAWGCQINAHRHRWNGTICNDPCNWECGADRKFRSEYCDQGDDRCYHAYGFARESGQIGVDENGIGWLMDSDRKALDGQVVFFYAYQTQEPQGMISNQRTVIAGIYIVDRVEKRDLGHKSQYWLYPKRGFAIELGDLQLQTERFQRLDRPYMRHFGQTEVNRMLQKILDALTRRNKNDIRIKQIAEIPSFIKSAAKTNAERRKKDEYDETSDYKQTPFATLKNFPISSKNPTPAEVNKKAKKEPETSVPHVEIPEPKVIQRNVSAFDFGLLGRNAAAYGLDTIKALWLAGARHNALILLRGAPGIGKSHLALSAVEKDKRHVVAVPSTWRGRDDLVGYVSPITGNFLPTGFADFLHHAECVWKSGDRTPMTVVFEEFNLSPPEHWFSDIIVRAQYDIDEPERFIELGGNPPAHWDVEGTTGIWLSPALRFIGTINTDHTTRDLSPRVLDRATLIQVELSPEAMLDRVELKLEQGQVQAIKDLHGQLESRGASFSVRTAISIKSALAISDELKAESTWEILDLILVTQVLGKVRLYAGEPRDMHTIDRLNADWVDEWGAKLPLCAGRFERWRELLNLGNDVIQA